MSGFVQNSGCVPQPESEAPCLQAEGWELQSSCWWLLAGPQALVWTCGAAGKAGREGRNVLILQEYRDAYKPLASLGKLVVLNSVHSYWNATTCQVPSWY